MLVDGGWSSWSLRSRCDRVCGGGKRQRLRSCTNPPPSSGGKGCGSHYYESKECAVNKCPGLSAFAFRPFAVSPWSSVCLSLSPSFFLFVCLPIYLSFWLFVGQTDRLSVHYRSFWLSVCLLYSSGGLFFWLCFCLSVCLLVCLSISLSVCLSTCASVCVYVRISVYLAVCLVVRMFVRLFVFFCLFEYLFSSVCPFVWLSGSLSVLLLCLCLPFKFYRFRVPFLRLVEWCVVYLSVCHVHQFSICLLSLWRLLQSICRYFSVLSFYICYIPVYPPSC